jgi:hypothetical protein
MVTGKDRDGPVRTRRGEFVVGQMAVPLRSGLSVAGRDLRRGGGR